ncbi:hypothetical protein FB45DRAFT_1059946 [Roridomyces roridus]|uniref:Uncharacterized protein n=1 Tax=Roridomyces roridus TaxID=1738132 RepID=A0AAD7BPV5_9AGAR|nr:hypothetical protein FB45DRAFT_1059946 [Roridomyces roridus]
MTKQWDKVITHQNADLMAPSIPDEIISEILTPVLHIPDVRFSYTTSTNSLFAISGESTSAILLVCKAWLRVSTPLLYNVIVLRSGAQARALASALKKNPELGLFIKKLRVEGGFGVCMHELLRYTPNITDIVVSLHLHSSDSSGLVLGLPLINPKQLIIWDEDDGRKMLNNKHVKQLMEALKGLKWTNLTTVAFPYSFSYSVAHRVDLMNTIIGMRSVTTASFPLNHLATSIHDEILALAEAASLQTLEIRAVASVRRKEKILADPKLSKWKNKLRFVDPRCTLYCGQVADPSPTSGTTSTRPIVHPYGASSQEIVDLVWKRVLYFAMLPNPEKQTHLGMWKRRNQKLKGPSAIRLEYLLVSKTFHRLGLEYLYRWPSVSSSNMQLFREKLAAEPSLGLHIRGLFSLSLGSPEPADPIQTPIFAHTPNLTRLGIHDPIALDWGMFSALADFAGASLVELAVKVVSQQDAVNPPPDLIMFSKFTALRTLSWDHTYDALSLELPSDTASGGFPVLESLDFRTTNAYHLMASMELPHIQAAESKFYSNFAEIEPFLIRHGGKIRALGEGRHRLAKILPLCPNLRDIHVRFPRWRYCFERVLQRLLFEEAIQDLHYPAQHHALVKMVFDKNLEGSKKEEEAEWTEILNAFEPGHFPALRELQVTRCEWPPINEHAIAQSAWVKRSERLLQFGIKLTDEAGVHWRRRLKR